MLLSGLKRLITIIIIILMINFSIRAVKGSHASMSIDSFSPVLLLKLVLVVSVVVQFFLGLKFFKLVQLVLCEQSLFRSS